MATRKGIVKSILVHVSVLVLLFGLVVCQNAESPQRSGRRVAASKNSRLSDELEEKQRALEQMRLETEQLLRFARQKELALTIREAHLDSLQRALNARADMLADKERTLRNIRVLSYFILLAGGILLIVGIVLITKSRAVGKGKSLPEKEAGDLAKTGETVAAKSKETKPAESQSTGDARKTGAAEEKKTTTRTRKSGGSRKPTTNE